MSYRYHLVRDFFGGRGRCLFIMLNPSTADDKHDDPTIRRCQGFVREWGYGELQVVNLFALRATNPKDMKAAEDPIGPRNNEAILEQARKASIIILAWGAHGSHQGRDNEVLELLGEFPLYCLGKNKDQSPKHPLYIPADTDPALYQAPVVV